MHTPRQILGNWTVDFIREYIAKQNNLQAQNIHEIAVEDSELSTTIDKIANNSKHSKVLYFIAHIQKPDGAHDLTILRHSISADGKKQTIPDDFIFSFKYSISLQSANNPTCIRVNYMEVQKNFRKTLVGPALSSIKDYYEREHPGAFVEARTDNLSVGRLLSSKLMDNRFIEITDPKKYPIMHAFDQKFVEILEKAGALEPEQAKILNKKLVQPLPTIEQREDYFIAIHNQLIHFIRENYSKHSNEAKDEVNFLFQKFQNHKEALDFIREYPYRGPLWIRGQLLTPKL
jgi:hypothetical protein